MTTQIFFKNPFVHAAFPVRGGQANGPLPGPYQDWGHFLQLKLGMASPPVPPPPAPVAPAPIALPSSGPPSGAPLALLHPVLMTRPFSPDTLMMPPGIDPPRHPTPDHGIAGSPVPFRPSIQGGPSMFLHNTAEIPVFNRDLLHGR